MQGRALENVNPVVFVTTLVTSGVGKVGIYCRMYMRKNLVVSTRVGGSLELSEERVNSINSFFIFYRHSIQILLTAPQIS